MTALHRSRDTIIYPAVFLMALCLNGFSLGVIFFLRDDRLATPTQIGLFTALDWLAYGIACQIIRPWFRRFPAVYVVGSAMALICCWLLAMTVTRPIGLLYILSAAKGVTMSLFWPIVMGWLTRGLEGTDLNQAMGRFNLTWSGGMIIGPFLIGWLCDYNAKLALTIAATTIGIIATYVLARGYRSTTIRTEIAGGGSATTNNIQDQKDHSTHLRWPAWAGLFLGFCTLGVVLTVFPQSGTDQFQLTGGLIGLLFLLRSLTSTITFVYLSKAEYWHFRRWPMCISAIGLSIALFCLTPTLLRRSASVLATLSSASWPAVMIPLTIIFAIMGILMAVVYNASLFHGAAGSIDRTSRMAIHESLLAIGWVVGSAVGGHIYQHFSPNHVWWGTAAIMILSAILTLILGKPRPQQQSA